MTQNASAPPRLTLGLASFVMFCFSACSNGSDDLNRPAPQRVPIPGQSEFFSADGQNGQESPTNRDVDTPQPGAPGLQEGDPPGERTVEEGDIYRVFSDAHRILNLNSYRGLQVIDFSNASAPEIVGHLRISGTPVEMYVVGNRAHLLLNRWQGYYGSPASTQLDRFDGGVVVSVDLSNPTAPRVIGRNQIPGHIQTSRLTRGSGGEALYVAASDGSTTYVRSLIATESGSLTQAAELDLGGWVSAIQATPEWLLVARYEAGADRGRSRVTVIDISDPTGAMQERTTVTTQGVVRNKFNMDIRGSMLRVVSANSWNSSTNTNHVETFDVAQESLNPNPIDHDTFGSGEDLYATLFLEHRAFFVTYRRVDPFHAFQIHADGTMTEMSEFVVSGWNDFFKPVYSQSRLIGIGKNDERGQTLAVSLYDITDLLNPHPLIERKEIDLDWSWSEANWDDRAFSVLENATSARSASGQVETGLVLLPYSGWESNTNTYISGVQVFTFSESTLTRRGTMSHGTPVRRSFLADGQKATTANLSDVELSLFDTQDPNAPAELGRLELAPNYSTVLLYGNHAMRRNSKSHFYAYWGNRDVLADDILEIVPVAGDIDLTPAVAEIAIPVGASIRKVGDRLAVISRTLIEEPRQGEKPVWETRIDLYDLSNVTSPRHVGDLTTRELPVTYFGPGYALQDCFDCRYFAPYSVAVEVAGDALVFVDSSWEQELEGTIRSRYLYPSDDQYGQRCWDADGPKACTFLTGGIQCRALTRVDGTREPEVCYGSIARCSQTTTGETTCTEVEDLGTISLQEHRSEYQQHRYWQHYDLHAVDVRAAPVLGSVVEMDRSEEFTSLLTEGAAVYLSYKLPHRIEGDARAYARHFFRAVDFTDPTQAETGPSINIPGELIAVDGNTILTRDTLWGRTIVESSIDRLEVRGSIAVLQGIRTFTDRVVEEVRLDDAGHVLVNHRQPWQIGYGPPTVSRSAGSVAEPEQTETLSILGLAEEGLPLLGELEINDWATLRDAIPARALFTVPGGLLVVNFDDPAQPYAQAYFSMSGWPESIELAGAKAYLAAGRFGIYTFDLNAFNLLRQ